MYNTLIMAETLTHLLNYNDKPLRAMSSRQYTSKIPASNGHEFTLGSEIIFNLPANELGKFLDFQHTTFDFEIENDLSAVTIPNRSGMNFCIKRLVCQCAGATLVEIDNWNQLNDMMMTLQSTSDYAGNVGKLLNGTHEKESNVTLEKDVKQSFSLNLNFNGLANINQYFPLFSRSSVQIRLLLDDAKNIFQRANTELVNSNFTLRDPVLRTKTIELSSSAFDAVVKSCDGRFDLTTTDYRYTSDSVPNIADGNVLTLNTNLGFAFSSLNAVMFSFRQNIGTADVAKYKPMRGTAGLTECCVVINGEIVPNRKIQVSPQNSGEIVAETLSSLGVLGHVVENRLDESTYLVQTPTASSSVNNGSFVGIIDMTSMRSEANRIIAGVSTIGSQVALEHTHTAVGANVENFIVDVYGIYTSMLSLDLRGSQNFVMSQ